jgi:hypothetical protein
MIKTEIKEFRNDHKISTQQNNGLQHCKGTMMSQRHA